LQLGRRVRQVEAAATLWNAVVIVGDSASYLEAIANWSIQRKYPVLIDDGTAAAHENIARFVRGFHPARVVRWSTKDAKPGLNGPDSAAAFACVARAWGLQGEKANQAGLLEEWKAHNYQPPGIVVTQDGDNAWTAAVALAAGRGELLTYLKVAQGVDALIAPADADALEVSIEGASEASGFPWKGVGGGLEAVTLCANAPVRIDAGKNEYLALTDRIGRMGKAAENGPRWAWCGEIFGDAQTAAYRVMCSLFLTPQRAWVFDGYPKTDPWVKYSGSEAAKVLREVGLNVELDETPRGGAKDWRLRAARAVNADLILVNSSGNADFFKLEPGECKPGDVPILTVPSALHIVHSWSLVVPEDRSTLGGTWLERGVFAYAGSVHEPYLAGFLPTPSVAARLVSGAPFGVAVRHDGGRVWKIAVLGDPLFTLMAPCKRSDAAPDALAGATDANATLRDLLTAAKPHEFAQALDILTLTGRDDQAAQLAQGILADPKQADKFTPEVAKAAVMPLMRAGDNRGVVKAFSRLDAAGAKDPVLRDALWLAAYPLMEQPDDDLLRLLRANLRPMDIGRDATCLAGAIARKQDHAAGAMMLTEIRASLTDNAQLEDLAKWMRESPDRWGK
jgi:hypothetical protein